MKIPIASGSIAAGLAQLDTTATNAFAGMSGVDLSAYQDGTHILALYNTVGGYAAWGYISDTAPGGETLGAELITGYVNGYVPYAPFDTLTVNANGHDINSGIKTSGGGRSIGYSNNLGLTVGWCYKNVVDPTINSGSGLLIKTSSLPNYGDGSIVFTDISSLTTLYRTTISTDIYYVILTGLGVNINFSLLNLLKQVTDPAATGALIVSTKGGATRDWASIDTLFNSNAACRWEIFKIIESNPIVEVSATTLWVKTPMHVNMIEWVDDNGDIVHDSTLVLNINGVPLTVKVQPLADELGHGAVVWRMGPFNPGVLISDFTITTMATGNLHVWLD